jgi:HK97 family phage major capsid protein
MSVFSGIIGALKHSPGNLVAAADFAKQTMSQNGVGDGVAMALSSVNASGGAVLIPTVLAQTVIERLIPNAVVRSMGPLSLPLNNGNLTMPRIAGGAVAGYIGRDNDAPVSQQTFDDVQLVAKKLACLVPIGNDLIRFAGIDQRVDGLIVEDTAFSMANAEDTAFIRGDGTNSTPKGLRNWCLPQNVLVATPIGTLSGQALIQAIMADAGRMVLALRRANVRLRKPGWLMHPDSVQFLGDLLTTTGNKVFPEIADGMFRGYPIGVTTEIPTNLTSSGATGNGSEIYFVDFAEMVIGESMNLSVAISMDATYTDPATGTPVSAFQRDLTLIRIITENDFGPRHAEAIAVLDGVTWYR